MDLGLSVYWATCNVGATTPEGYGDYFAWGETTTKETYSLESYSLTKDDGSTFTKYNDTDGKTTLEPTDDAATAKWGAAWRMPTEAEFEELCTNCYWEWTTINGVNGCKVTSEVEGYTDAAIFLPAAGWCYGGPLEGRNIFWYYWSSSLYFGLEGVDDRRAYVLAYNSGSEIQSCHRYAGLPVRPVTEK